MSSLNSKSRDDLILHQALDARMLKAIEFASIAADLERIDIDADAYLVEHGYITEEQRKQLLDEVADEGIRPQDATQTGSTGDRQPTPDCIQRPSAPSSSASPSSRVNAIHGVVRSLSQEETRYEWTEKFAQGGLGAVWRAHDTTIDRNVALKEIQAKVRSNAATVQQFLTEARITGQLQHPGVVPIYDIGLSPEGSPFYIMKFVEGQTLHHAIRRHFTSNLSKTDAANSLRHLLTVFVSVCRTMSYAHDQGYIHRDLKPRNIMLGDYAETLVVDWGLAKPVVSQDEETIDISKPSANSGSRSSRSGRSSERRVVGTPAYLAPEQARGEVDKMDGRSDIYSLGVVLFEILTGETPFSGEDSKTIIEAVLGGEFTPPVEKSPGVPSPLNSICIRAMEQEKKHRFQSARELADEIERFLAGNRVLCHPETRVEQAQRILGKNQKATLTALCGMALLTLVVGVSAFQINKARHAEREARLAAVAARKAETAARQRETLAKDEAVANLRSAVDAVDTWLLQLSGDLEFYPGLADKRTEFLEQAATYYSKLSQSQCDDKTLKSEAARSAIRGGDVRQLLGRADEAAPLFESAVTWFRAQRAAKPNDIDVQKELANALIGQAIALAGEERTRTLSVESIEEANGLLTNLVAQRPGDLEIRTALARACVAEARLHRSKVDASGTSAQLAIARFEDARRRLVEVVRYPDVAARHVALYHTTLFELIDLYSVQDDFAAASEIARDAIRSFDRLIADSPSRPDFYEGRMTSRILYGNVCESMSRETDALDAYTAASDDFKLLMDSLFRGEFHSENLVVAQVNRARILSKRGELDEATGILRFARDESSQLIQLNGQQPRLLRIFAAAATALGEVEVANSEFENATKDFQDAVIVLKHLQAEGTASSEDEDRLRNAQEKLRTLAAAQSTDSDEPE